jgi:hypothetical protein
MGPRVQENGTQHLGNLGGIRGNGTQIWGSLWETQPWLLVTFSYWRPSMFSGATFGIMALQRHLVEIVFGMVLAMALVLAATTWAFSPNPAAPIPPSQVIYQPQHWNAY